MQTVYEAAGGREGLLRLARAWHARVLEDEVVGHAFSHGYHPQHTERLARTGRRHWVGQRPTPTSTVMRPLSCGFTAATVRTRRWTSGRSFVSIRRWKMSASPATNGSDACCTITSPGSPQPRCLVTTIRQRMYRTVCKSRSGPGRDSSVEPRLTTLEKGGRREFFALPQPDLPLAFNCEGG